jgi:hypothetical protein
MFKGKVLLFSLLMVFATSLFAGDVDDCRSSVEMSCDTMRVSICPAGDFQTFETGCIDGSPDGHVIVYVRDASGVGIPDVPWTDYWFDVCDLGERLNLCASPLVADSLTNSLGRTTFSGTISGGGCVLTGGIQVSCQGKTFLIETSPGVCTTPICIEMMIVSPDYNNDLLVDIIDLSFFGPSYNKPPSDPAYDDCCDYNHDGECDLTDFSFFGAHYLHECF